MLDDTKEALKVCIILEPPAGQLRVEVSAASAGSLGAAQRRCAC